MIGTVVNHLSRKQTQRVAVASEGQSRAASLIQKSWDETRRELLAANDVVCGSDRPAI